MTFYMEELHCAIIIYKAIKQAVSTACLRFRKWNRGAPNDSKIATNGPHISRSWSINKCFRYNYPSGKTRNGHIFISKAPFSTILTSMKSWEEGLSNEVEIVTNGALEMKIWSFETFFQMVFYLKRFLTRMSQLLFDPAQLVDHLPTALMVT